MPFVGPIHLVAVSSAADHYTWDGTLSEQHTLVNDITDHPVEEGGSVSDHNRPKSDVLVIEAMVTDRPLIDDGTVIDPLTAEPQIGRSKAAFLRFVELAKSGLTFTVTTALRDYDNMALEGLETGRSGSVGGGPGAQGGDASKAPTSLRFTLRMKQIRIVRTKVVNLKATNLARGKPKRAIGKATLMAFAEGAEAIARARLLTPDPLGASGSGSL